MKLDLENLTAMEKAATAAPWKWWTSNSWRRLKRDDRGITQNVLEPYVCRDGHPDCSVSEEDQELIATLRNAAPELIRAARMLEKAAEALKPFVEWSRHDLATANELQPDLYAYDDGSEADVREFDGNGTSPLLWGDLRRAARVYALLTAPQGDGDANV